eukprot:3062151-Prorocentrum_lima.AAC.1
MWSPRTEDFDWPSQECSEPEQWATTMIIGFIVNGTKDEQHDEFSPLEDKDFTLTMRCLIPVQREPYPGS